MAKLRNYRQVFVLYFSCAVAVVGGGLGSRNESLTSGKSSRVGQGPYEPLPASKEILGDVVNLLSRCIQIDGSAFTAHPAKYICKLPGGQIYFETATADIDDDGNSDGSPQNWEPHPIRHDGIDVSHQDQTSYGSMIPHSGKSDFISAFNESYIVLPGKDSFWFRDNGLTIGDGAIVIKGTSKIVVVFADVGPDENLGEMSVKAHQQFGFNTFESGSRPKFGKDGKPLRDPQTGRLLRGTATVTVNRAQNGPFIVIVFPHTSTGKDFVSVQSTLLTKIDVAFRELNGSLPPSSPK